MRHLLDSCVHHHFLCAARLLPAHLNLDAKECEELPGCKQMSCSLTLLIQALSPSSGDIIKLFRWGGWIHQKLQVDDLLVWFLVNKEFKKIIFSLTRGVFCPEVLPTWWCHTFPDAMTGSGSCSLEQLLSPAPSSVGRRPLSISLRCSSLPLSLTLSLSLLLCCVADTLKVSVEGGPSPLLPKHVS